MPRGPRPWAFVMPGQVSAMPVAPDVPCSTCGRLMWRGTGSLPPGEATCLDCRRALEAYVPTDRSACVGCGKTMRRSVNARGEARCLDCRRKLPSYTPKPKAATFKPELRFCDYCSEPYEAQVRTQRYCSPSCRDARHRSGTKTGSTEARGYGAAHRRERARWAPIVARGDATCCLCDDPIAPSDAWHLDHQPDRSGYRGVAHATCNLRDGARRGNRIRGRARAARRAWAP